MDDVLLRKRWVLRLMRYVQAIILMFYYNVIIYFIFIYKMVQKYFLLL